MILRTTILAEGFLFPEGPRWHEGAIAHRVQVTTRPYACMLGGPERRTLFVCTAESTVPGRGRRQVGGRIEIMKVEVPGDGIP